MWADPSRPLPSLTVGRRKTMQDEVGLLQSAISCWSRLERRARRSAADNAENGRIRAGGWQGGPLPSLPVTARPLPTLLWTHYLHWAAEPGLVSPGPRAALRYEDSQLAVKRLRAGEVCHRVTPVYRSPGTFEAHRGFTRGWAPMARPDIDRTNRGLPQSTRLAARCGRRRISRASCPRGLSRAGRKRVSAQSRAGTRCRVLRSA